MGCLVPIFVSLLAYILIAPLLASGLLLLIVVATVILAFKKI